MPRRICNWKICICLFLVGFAVACTMTVTKTKNPIFLVGMDSIRIDMNKILAFEHIGLVGRETDKNGKLSSELEVDIINGKNIPGDDSAMRILGNSIASDLKKALKDKNEYDTYKVLFVIQEMANGTTKRSWKGDVFKSEEL
jgi:hypothetical protein